MKKVKFKKEVINTNVTIKCNCCGHRNIKPLIRQIFKCSVCFLDYCIHCFLYAKHICVYCNGVNEPSHILPINDPSTLLEMWSKINLNVKTIP